MHVTHTQKYDFSGNTQHRRPNDKHSQELLRIYTSREATHVSYELTLSYRNLKKSCFLKKQYVDGKYQVEINKMMKPKMVPMVHRNILYRMDFKLSDSKIRFLMKTQN